MIYTSYFANLRNLPGNVAIISICAKPPNWYKGLAYKKLAPPYDVLMKYKGDGNEEDYIREFQKRVLSRLNPDEVVRELHALTNKPNIALLCYERPEKFCHRHLVADWLNDHGIECLEYGGE